MQPSNPAEGIIQQFQALMAATKMKLADVVWSGTDTLSLKSTALWFKTIDSNWRQ